MNTHRALPWLASLLWALCLGVLARRVIEADYGYILWSDRDMWRTARVWIDLPTSGAEMNYGSGGRLPGGTWHGLTALALAPRGEPTDVWRALTLLDSAAMVALAALAHRRWGAAAGAVTLAALVVPSDVRSTFAWLWNPMLLPAMVSASIVALDRALRPGATSTPWLLGGVALAVGAHAHFTAVSWALATAIALAIVAPAAARRGLPLGAVGFALPYLPWLAHEATTGWVEAARLRDQSAGSVPTVAADVGRELLEVGGMLLADPRAGAAITALSALPLALAVVGGAVAWRRGADDALARVLTVGVAAILLTPPLATGVLVEERYLLAALPGLAVLAARGVAAVPSQPWLLAACAAWPAAELLRAPTSPHPFLDAVGLFRLIDHLAPAVGGPAGVAGRLLLLTPGDAGWTIPEPTPFDLRLHQAGATFPGSLPGPCFAVFAGPAPDDAASAIAAAASLAGATELDRAPGPDGATIVRFTAPDDRCPTVAVNRYVPLPEEAPAMEVFDAVTHGRASVTPTTTGLRVVVGHRLTADVGPAVPLAVVLDLTPRPGGLELRWASNQLRGHAYNGGWFTDAAVVRPALRLTAEDGRVVEHILYTGLVGPSGVVPPWTTTVDLPPGRWRVGFTAAALSGVERGRATAGQPIALDADAWIEVPL
jgi:hypothetical protein